MIISNVKMSTNSDHRPLAPDTLSYLKMYVHSIGFFRNMVSYNYLNLKLNLGHIRESIN